MNTQVLCQCTYLHCLDRWEWQKYQRSGENNIFAQEGCGEETSWDWETKIGSWSSQQWEVYQLGERKWGVEGTAWRTQVYIHVANWINSILAVCSVVLLYWCNVWLYRSKMGATLTERYEMKDKSTKRLTHDFEKLRKDLRKVSTMCNVVWNFPA